MDRRASSSAFDPCIGLWELGRPLRHREPVADYTEDC
jgi:hypothetical protein